MKNLYFLLLLIPLISFSQTNIADGVPADLKNEKVILLKHEAMEYTVSGNEGKAEEYVHHRQKTHNSVIEEANTELVAAALAFPFAYAFATYSTYQDLMAAGYKYVLISQVYKNDYLRKHPEEGELIVFEYFLFDPVNDVAYKLFEMDEMKVYDSKLLIKKLNKALKSQYPELY